MNPFAGGGDRRFTKLLAAKQAGLERELGPIELLRTEGPRHAEELARRAVAFGASLIVAVGGDGTVHEVVNGMAGSEACLGVIPLGTGNDFATALGIPRSFRKAFEVLAKGWTRRIDLGRANDRYFAGVASVGFDAEVAALAKEGPRFLKAYSAYALAVWKAWRRFRPKALSVEAGDQIFTFKGWLVAGANIHTYGGGFLIAPGAQVDDGLLDFCLVGEASRLEFLAQSWKALFGRHVKHPKVISFRAPEATLTGDPSLILQADGEVLGTLPARLQAIPQALKVVVPPHPFPLP